MSYDMLWREVINMGPMGLTRHDWNRLLPELSPDGRTVLKHFLLSLERQSQWIVTREAQVRDEADRILRIGHMLKAAGLRSYTDEDGRIFISGDYL